MGIEYELKFRATAAQRAAILEAYPGQWRTISMETTYYDTSSGALSARHVTLRRRLENGASICTFKTPAGALGRGEWECECGDIAEAVPMLCKLGCPAELSAWTAEGLIPICGARFTRRARIIDLGNTRVELALDSGAILGGGREQPLSEAEAELKSGSREDTAEFARCLAQRFGLEPEPKSKFRRALDLAKGV